MHGGVKHGLYLLYAAAFVLVMVASASADRLDARDLAYEAMDVYKEDGFHLRDELQVGKLYKGESYYFDTQLSAGNQYFFYAAGDKSVLNIEVRVYDENWKLVASNTSGEPQAEATFKPDWSGIFHIKISMVDALKDGAYWFIVSGYK